MFGAITDFRAMTGKVQNKLERTCDQNVRKCSMIEKCQKKKITQGGKSVSIKVRNDNNEIYELNEVRIFEFILI